MDAYRGPDAVGMYLTGGAYNSDPALSLGGDLSSVECNGMAPIITSPVQGLVIENATPANGIGEAQIVISSGSAVYTPPGAVAGPAAEIAEGERKVLTGNDTDRAVRIYRVASESFTGTATFKLVDAMNSILSMSDVDDTDRQAGLTTYRGLILSVDGPFSAAEIAVWVSDGGQASYEIGKETPVADAIQTIADEETAPAAVSFSAAVSEDTAVTESIIPVGGRLGLWIKRIFPIGGIGSAKNTVKFHLKFRGA